jgi:protein O-GlcNAc transferase
VRDRLAENRLNCPLFDTLMHTQKLEAAYIAAHQRHLEGLAPEKIDIA